MCIHPTFHVSQVGRVKLSDLSLPPDDPTSLVRIVDGVPNGTFQGILEPAGGVEDGSAWAGRDADLRSVDGSLDVTSWTDTCSGPSAGITLTSPLVRQEAPFKGG